VLSVFYDRSCVRFTVAHNILDSRTSPDRVLASRLMKPMETCGVSLKMTAVEKSIYTYVVLVMRGAKTQREHRTRQGLKDKYGRR
jgi:hypothetical protein